MMKGVFGIDISKFASIVCELIGESKNKFEITNDRPGFIQLLKKCMYLPFAHKLFLKQQAFIRVDCRPFLKIMTMSFLNP